MTDDEFCALYEAHARRLWAYVMRATRDAAAADDVVQESFTRIFTAAAITSADPEHRRRYLYKVATNLVHRRYRTQAAVLMEPPDDSAAQRMENKLAVEEALEALSVVERQTLWLAYVEGWSWREVAQILGYREGSIRQVAVRARQRFRERFAVRRHKSRHER
jgi:RNA polymerase sigma factor (sigma-70 family)